MTYEMKSVFGTVFNGKKNTLRARRAIAQELYVPSSAVSIANDEMEYVNGGWDVRFETRSIWGIPIGLDAVFTGTVADAAWIIGAGAAFVALIAGLMAPIPVVGVPASINWVVVSAGLISFLAVFVATHDAASTATFTYRMRLL